MWGIAVIIAACCLAFGAVDAAAKMRERKAQSDSFDSSDSFTAMVFLIFTLLYTPCVAAIATVKREMGGTKAAVITVIVQCLIAWVVAFLVHAVGLAFGVV